MTERVSLLGQAAGFKPSAPAGPTHQERQAAQDRIIDLLKGGVMNDPLHTGRAAAVAEFQQNLGVVATPPAPKPKTVRVLGREFDPREESDAHAAAGQALKLMRDRAYGDKSDPRHPIFVDEVARLFEIVHPEGGQ